MNCLECQTLLQRKLDGEPVLAAADLDRHLASCIACRQNFQAAERLLAGLPRLRTPKLPASFAQEMAGRVLRDREQRRRVMRSRVWITVGLAASILFVAWAGNVWLPKTKQGTDQPPLVQKKPADAQNPQPANPEPVEPLAQHVGEAKTAVTTLTERWADQTREQAKLFLSVASAPAQLPLPQVDLQTPLDPAADSLRQASQGVSGGLQVVGQSALRAVEFFAKEIPFMEGSANN